MSGQTLPTQAIVACCQKCQPQADTLLQAWMQACDDCLVTDAPKEVVEAIPGDDDDDDDDGDALEAEANRHKRVDRQFQMERGVHGSGPRGPAGLMQAMLGLPIGTGADSDNEESGAKEEKPWMAADKEKEFDIKEISAALLPHQRWFRYAAFSPTPALLPPSLRVPLGTHADLKRVAAYLHSLHNTGTAPVLPAGTSTAHSAPCPSSTCSMRTHAASRRRSRSNRADSPRRCERSPRSKGSSAARVSSPPVSPCRSMGTRSRPRMTV